MFLKEKASTKTDLVGKYFHSLWLAGDKREFYFLFDEGKPYPVIYPVRHDESDGQCGFENICAEKNLSFSRSLNADRVRPSFMAQLNDLFNWLLIIPRNRAIWKTRTGEADLQKFSSFRIPNEKLDELKGKLKQENISLNGFLIKTLNDTCLPYYKNSQNSWWLLPVALPDSERNNSGNHISFLDLYLTPDMSAKKVGDELSQKLKSGVYWGHYLAFKLLHFVSPSLLSKFLPMFFGKFQRTVTFSHLGRWTVDGIGPGKLDAIAPAFSLSPLFVMLIEINGELVISLSQQSHLDLPIHEITRKWQDSLLSNL